MGKAAALATTWLSPVSKNLRLGLRENGSASVSNGLGSEQVQLRILQQHDGLAVRDAAVGHHLHDGGTTAVQLARALASELRATVVTHSPSVAVELVSHPGIEVIMIGGRLFKHSIVNMGPTALEAIAQIRADLYFMGVCSLHPEHGISTGDFDEAGIKRALSDASQRTVVLASPEKLATASPYQIMPLARVGAIVVHRSVAPELSAPYRDLGIDIVLA